MSPAPVAAPPCTAIVGHPGHRRVTAFQAALRAAGHPPARVVPWARVLAGTARFRDGDAVRVESPGEDRPTDLLLRGVTDPTRVEGGARWYRSFLAAVEKTAHDVRAAGGTLLGEPAELAVLFDKRLCHAALDRAGVPVPPSPTSGAAAPVRGWPDLRALLARPGLRRVFVKPAHGSSASGVMAVETGAGGRIRATTSVERTSGGALHNSLRVRRYEDERTIGAITDALAPDGLHVERWLPKASQHGRSADLRVVAVAGRATHAVVRTAAGPLTNLHLGGARGDLDEVRAAVAAAGASFDGLLRMCEATAAVFPGTPCVGVDVLPATGWRRFTVGEVNAFGDLLPGLTGLPEGPAAGTDTYAAQVAAYARSRTAPAPARP